MSRAAFSTAQWRIKIKRGISEMPRGYNQILLEGLLYSTPPKNKNLIKFKSPIYEFAKEFAEEHKAVGYLNDGRLSQDSITFSSLKYDYLKKGMSNNQASLQAKRDLIKKIETRAMELDMIQSQALRMGLPSYRPETHLDHMLQLNDRIQDRRVELEELYRSEGLEETIRLKLAYNDNSPLTFTQVSMFSPQEYAKFVSEHSDFKTILSQPVVKDKVVADISDGIYSSAEDKLEAEDEREAAARELGISLKDEANPKNILGFRLSEYNVAIGFKSEEIITDSTGGFNLTNQLEQQLSEKVDQLSSLEQKMKSLGGGYLNLGFHDFKKQLEDSNSKSPLAIFSSFKLKEEDGSFKLATNESTDQLFYTAQKSHSKKTLVRLPIISAIQTMHHNYNKGNISKELLAYLNRDEGSRDKSGEIDLDAETLVSKSSYLEPTLQNIGTMLELTEYNEIPFSQQQQQQKTSQEAIQTVNQRISNSVRSTIDRISNSLFVNPSLNKTKALQSQGNIQQEIEETIDEKNIIKEARINSMKSSIARNEYGILDLSKSNIHSTFDILDTIERFNNEEEMEEYEEECGCGDPSHHHLDSKGLESLEKEELIPYLIDQETFDVSKGHSSSNPDALLAVRDTLDPYHFPEIDEPSPILNYLCYLQDRNSELNTVNGDIDGEDKIDFRKANFPVELLDKYKSEINEFRAKESRGEVSDSDYIEFTNYISYLIQNDYEPYVVQRLRQLEGLPATPYNNIIEEFNSTLPPTVENDTTTTPTDTNDNPIFKALKELYPDPKEFEDKISQLLYRGISIKDNLNSISTKK